MGQKGKTAADSDHESTSSEAECFWVGRSFAGPKGSIEAAARESRGVFELFETTVSMFEGVYLVVVCGSGAMASWRGSGYFSSGACAVAFAVSALLSAGFESSGADMASSSL